MTENTINDAQTIAGNSGALLAGLYRVVRQLGHGGMGSVWLAEDTQLDGKQFAIKMLPSILVSNKRAYRQLKDEALVAMQLVHSNIVQIRAFEENNGNPFLVMDYIDGQTLDDYLAEKGKLSEDEVIRVLRPIAAALDYAHVEGVVHRDVKPANVMIRKDGHPFVLDFGIAREIQETMTRVTGKLSSGTLLYMSPEQLNGEPPRKEQDIYSFAAMAYECMKGAPPFVRGAIEDQIKNKIPDPLPNSPSVMAGLAKKPEDRPPSCAAVLAGATSRDGAEKRRSEDSRVECNAKGTGKAIFIVALLVALLGGICAWWMLWRNDKEAKIEDTPPPAQSVPAVTNVPVAPVVPESPVALEPPVVTNATVVPDVPVVPDAPDVVVATNQTEETECQQPEDRQRNVDDEQEKRFLAERLISVTNELYGAIKERARLHDEIEESIKNVRQSPRGFGTLLAKVDNVRKRCCVVSGELSLETAEAALESVRADQRNLMELKDEIGGGNLESRVAERDVVVAKEMELDKCMQLVLQKRDRSGTYLQQNPEWNDIAQKLSTARASIDAGNFHGLSRQLDEALSSCKRIADEVCSYLSGLESADVNGEKRDDVQAVRNLIKAMKYGISDAGKSLYSFCVLLQNDRAKTIAECRKLVANNSFLAGDEALQHCDELLKRLRHEMDVLLELPVSDRELPVVMTQHGLKAHEEWSRKVAEIRARIKGEIDRTSTEITKTLDLPGGEKMEFIYCKPGAYVWGDGNLPQKMDHGFWLGRYAVTQRQWQSVMGENPASFNDSPQHPVENVSWEDCQEFILKIEEILHCGARLPTEQEWEYACRAGSRTTYSWGGELNGDMANCNGSVPYGTGFGGKNEKKTVEVGSYRPNAWGFYDMHGNVWEWCSDRFDDRNMVIRGGSWRNSAYECRSASRRGLTPKSRINTIGFRLCLTDAQTGPLP